MPDQGRQFANIRDWIDIVPEIGLTIISVDGMENELIGNCKIAGATWCREPEEVYVYVYDRS